MTAPDSALSVVIPAYNCEGSLEPLMERLAPVLEGLQRPFEVVLVNDSSRDRTWQTIVDLSASRPWLRGIDLMRNYGQHNALLCGIRAARNPIVVTLDDDLQNPPEEIPLLLLRLDEGWDVVYGTPVHARHGLARNLASQFTKFALQSAMGAGTASQVSAFRVFRTSLRDAFVDFRGPFVSIDVLLTWGSTRFTSVPVRQDTRAHGESNYTLGMLTAHALNMMTGFSTLPLQVASIMGFLFTLFGILILVFVVVRFILQGTPVPGFPFLASIIAIFSGAELFALGIIGEYLARMHFRVMDRPPYTVRGKAGRTQKMFRLNGIPDD